MSRALMLAAGALLVSGCSLVIDADPVEGHPCSEHGACLRGYACVDGWCVPEAAPDAGASGPADAGTYGPSDGGDLDGGAVPDAGFPDCLCPTGLACTDDDACEDAAGLGRACGSDGDCDGVVAGCTLDPSATEGVRCACLRPASLDRGACVAIVLSGGCAECDDGTTCLEVSEPDADGAVQARALCAPRGMATCGGNDPCAAGDDLVCSLHDVSGLRVPAAACASSSPSAIWALGAPCNPETPWGCESGLCVPGPGGEHVCTLPCDDDGDCDALEGACVRAAFDVRHHPDEPPVPTMGRVCGVGPSLGAVCDPAELPSLTCGTDAPLCPDAGRCTRPCTADADCAPERGFVCMGGLCLVP